MSSASICGAGADLPGAWVRQTRQVVSFDKQDGCFQANYTYVRFIIEHNSIRIIVLTQATTLVCYILSECMCMYVLMS